MKKRVLLIMAPYHPALITPLGMACLKSYLVKKGYSVSIIDYNVNKELQLFYTGYFNKMGEYIPEDARANFLNIGNEAIRHHMMAFINGKDSKDYFKVIKEVIYRTFYYEVDDVLISELNEIITEMYKVFKQEVLTAIDTHTPDVIGISTFKGTFPATLFASQFIKEYNKDIKVILGGGVFADQLALNSPDLKYFVDNSPHIDKIIIGEGEELFYRYLEGELPDSQKIYSLKDIDFKVLDLSEVPVPDMDDYNLDLYPHIANYASRSCPFQCSFCGETVNWGNYRKKDPAVLTEELLAMNKKFKGQLFYLCDSLLNPMLNSISKVLIQNNANIYFDGYLRADKHVCNQDTVLNWRRAGFYRARLGLESGSEKILSFMDKKITPGQIKEAARSLANAGIKTTTYWIVGYPGETEEDFQKTLSLIKEMKDDIYEAEANPFWYFKSATVKAGEWDENCKSLFSEEANDMLLLKTFYIDIEPKPYVRYDRLNRFVKHCADLEIPNPYSLMTIFQADERWKSLHKNAVPSLLELIDKGKEYNEDRKAIK